MLNNPAALNIFTDASLKGTPTCNVVCAGAIAVTGYSEINEYLDRPGTVLSGKDVYYTEQINAGEDYHVFKRCVSISILDFELFKNESEFYSCFHIREDSRHFLYTDKMEFHVLELPKLPKELKEDSNDIELWGKFINAERKEEFVMLAEKNTYIGSAYRHLQLISQDDEKRMEYEARTKAIRDYNQVMLEAEKRGEARGRSEEKMTGIQILIADHIEEEIPKEKTITKLKKHYHLTEKEAEEYYKKYSKNDGE